MTKRVNLGAVSLSVSELGHGRSVIFLHGFPDNGGAWREVAELLSDRFHCILPDQRGYGLSDQPDAVENYTIDKLIGDIDALADAFSLKQFALAGHDWGGVLAWWYAARNGERLSHLIIANAPHPALFQKAIIDSTDQRLAAQYIARLRQPGSEVHVPNATKAMVNWYRAAPFVVPTPDEPAAWPDWVLSEDFTVDVPTLVLWGWRDTLLLPVLLEDLYNYVPDLQIRRFDQVGHDIIHEIAADVAEAIKDFLT